MNNKQADAVIKAFQYCASHEGCYYCAAVSIAVLASLILIGLYSLVFIAGFLRG